MAAHPPTNITRREYMELIQFGAANDSLWRRVAVRMRFKKKKLHTPLADAEHIMGDNIHRVQEVRYALRHDDDFAEQNAHLTVVPFTTEELEWASEHGVILTIHSRSVQRLLQVTRGTVSFPHGVLSDAEKIMCHRPKQAGWHLFLRTRPAHQEDLVLRSRPKSLVSREHIPSLDLALSATTVDLLVRNHLPPPHTGPRLTASVIKNADGSVAKRILVQGGVIGDRPIAVAASQSHAEHPPCVAWKPHPFVAS